MCAAGHVHSVIGFPLFVWLLLARCIETAATKTQELVLCCRRRGFVSADFPLHAFLLPCECHRSTCTSPCDRHTCDTLRSRYFHVLS